MYYGNQNACSIIERAGQFDAEKDAELYAAMETTLGYLEEVALSDSRWRDKEEANVAFYDGYAQWDEAARAELERRRQLAVVVNQTKSTILRLESGIRANPIGVSVKPVGWGDRREAQLCNAGLNYIFRLWDLPAQEAKAFGWMLKYGIGAFCAGNYLFDPSELTEKVQFLALDPREVFVDLKALNSASRRYAGVRKAVSIRDLHKVFGEVAKDFDAWCCATPLSEVGNNDTTGRLDMWLDAAYTRDGEVGSASDFANSNKLYALVEVWERVLKFRDVVKTPEGTTIAVPDGADYEWFAALEFPEVRSARVWVTEHTIMCRGFVFLREELPELAGALPIVYATYDTTHNGDPQSMITDIADLQLEINYRRSRAIKEISNPSIRVTNTVLTAMGLTKDTAAAYYDRGGSVWVGGTNEVELLTKMDLANSHMSAMQQSKEDMSEMTGTNAEFMGAAADSGRKSAQAKQSDIAMATQRVSRMFAMLEGAVKELAQVVLNLMLASHRRGWRVRLEDLPVGFAIDGQTPESDALDLTPLTASRLAANLEIRTRPWGGTLREESVNALTELLKTEANPMVAAEIRRAVVQQMDVDGADAIIAAYDRYNPAQNAGAGASESGGGGVEQMPMQVGQVPTQGARPVPPQA